MECPIVACDQTDVPYDHVFSAETQSFEMDFIRRNHKPQFGYDDVRNRPCDPTHDVDALFSGPRVLTSPSLVRVKERKERRAGGLTTRLKML